MTTPVFQEIFRFPIDDFKEHLLQSENERIIFSGKYGIGKTRFLEHFFSEQNQRESLGKEIFVVYRLSPVNYSIAATEDILDYIKYDIIYEFLKKGYSFDQRAIDYLQSLPSFLRKHLIDVIKALVYMIPEVGKETVESFDKLKAIADAFIQHSEKERKSDGDLLATFLDQLEAKPGSPYINDIVTKIIQKVVNRDDRSSILIIDDLDRLDPEHIFRILNVFSSHFSSIKDDGTSNKFGFQKVILVCDFNNLRTLFHHRYGQDSDFLGYVDKFYSTEVFHFDNRTAILSIIKKVFDSLRLGVSEQEAPAVRQELFSDKLFYEVVSLLLEKGFLSLRSILKMWQKPFVAYYKEVSFSQEIVPIRGYSIPVMMQLALLADTVGDWVQLEKAFKNFEQTRLRIDGYDTAFSFLMALLSYSQKNYFHSPGKSPFFIYWRGLRLAVRFTTNQNTFAKLSVFPTVDGEDHNDPYILDDDPLVETATPERFWQAMTDALALLRQIRFIK